VTVGQDVFVHISMSNEAQLGSLAEGQRVLMQSLKRKRASSRSHKNLPNKATSEHEEVYICANARRSMAMSPPGAFSHFVRLRDFEVVTWLVEPW